MSGAGSNISQWVASSVVTQLALVGCGLGFLQLRTPSRTLLDSPQPLRHLPNSLTLLFWNINRRPLARLVASAARENEADVVVMAECHETVYTLLTALNTAGHYKYSYPFAPDGKLIVLTRFPRSSLRPVQDPISATLRRLRAPLLPEILLVAAHMPSKLHMSDDDQTHACVRLVHSIEQAEKKLGHRRTIVIGDLNMNPFESAVVGSSGFHAVMSRQIARRGQRVVQQEQRPMFYNPMWSHFGDRPPSPPGTYFFQASAPVTYFWNMFDQVLIRPDLLDHLDDGNVRVITSVEGVGLLDAAGIPDTGVGSDHLPLIARLSF